MNFIQCICSEDAINWSDITIQSLAFIVSSVAVFFTWRGLKIQREHNFKSVKPIGQIRLGDYQSKIYVRIKNSGTGPLILKKVIVNGQELKTNEGLIDTLSEKLRERIVWTNFTSNYTNRAIPANEALELLVWSINSHYDGKSSEVIETDRDEIRNELHKFDLKIIYTDVYEHELFEDEIKFDWFGRNLNANN
jgi:hypothetical protein